MSDKKEDRRGDSKGSGSPLTPLLQPFGRSLATFREEPKNLPPAVASREQETFVFGNSYAFNYFSSAKYLMVRTI